MNRSPTIQHINLEKSKSKGRVSKAQRFHRPSRAAFRQDADYTVRKSLAELVRDELFESKQELFHQRVFMFGKNAEKKEDDTEDFYDSFRDSLDKVINHVEEETFTEDKLNGLFLCMGEITLLVVEGAEDMVDEFFQELWLDCMETWTETRVFLVEDKIKSVYFDAFLCYRSVAVNVNEKYPTATPNDEYEMFLQHWKIKGKLHALCETLSGQLREEDPPDFSDDFLPPDIYNKFLPEVQRLELVFLSKRFYRNLHEHAKSYEEITIKEGELDTMIWPLQYNYTPAGIFKSSEFEVNLTFGDYGKEEAKQAEPEAVVEEEEVEGAASNI